MKGANHKTFRNVLHRPPADVGNRHDVQRAILRLRRESVLYALQTSGSLLCGATAFASFIVAVIRELHGWPNVALLLCCLLCMVIAGSLFPRFDRASLDVLAAAPDVKMIGPLLDAMIIAPEPKIRAIQSLLTSLLPLLREPDCILLTSRQRRLLYDTLLLGDADRELDYLLAVLQAVTQIGDTDALRCLRQVVQLGAMTDGQTRLLAEATESLRIVEARHALQRQHGSLLRASALSESPTELLRAAHNGEETSPETLLRPIN